MLGWLFKFYGLYHLHDAAHGGKAGNGHDAGKTS
jgi:hypothetical protein